jgi:two-component system cell cycle response regulator
MESIFKPTQSFSMLLVEDEAATLELLAIILPKKYSGALLHTAGNGRTGLDVFKTHTPAIVITDFNMPEMCGSHMVDEIRAIKPDSKFIVITGDTGIHALEDSAQKGFKYDHFIAKPVVFQELFGAIDQCLAEIEQQTNSEW